jgi:16S rRNA (adenine1518-N6/adenine1519-N6)-dimethyltransferase
LAPKKALGQHFLLDENLTRKIARLGGSLSGRHVIEIGPGPGGLTRALLGSDAASVTAIELDRRAIAALQDLKPVFGERFRLIEGDALALDLPVLVPAPRQIIANLPYNIGTALLIAWLKQARDFERMTLMFQQEVAERIIAAPNSAGYGRLSVLAQTLCEVAIVMRLPPEAFTPPPAVYSAIVAFVPKTSLPDAATLAALERLTAAAFGQRRKMLRASLRALGGEALLLRANIAPERRAETVTVDEFLTLARVFNSVRA